MSFNLVMELSFVFAVFADYGRFEIEPTAAQNGAGFDEYIETFFGNQPADTERAQLPALVRSNIGACE